MPSHFPGVGAPLKRSREDRMAVHLARASAGVPFEAVTVFSIQAGPAVVTSAVVFPPGVAGLARSAMFDARLRYDGRSVFTSHSAEPQKSTNEQGQPPAANACASSRLNTSTSRVAVCEPPLGSVAAYSTRFISIERPQVRPDARRHRHWPITTHTDGRV